MDKDASDLLGNLFLCHMISKYCTGMSACLRCGVKWQTTKYNALCHSYKHIYRCQNLWQRDVHYHNKVFLAISRSICAAIGFLSQMSLLCRCCMVQLVPQSSDSVLKSFLALDLQLATCVIWCLVQCPTSCGLSVLLGDRITVVKCMLKSLTWLCYLPQSRSFSSHRYFCANTYSEWHCRVWLRRSVLREHCISS